jgi:tRNA A-37 threonylcarbamoyl transferase component Bud32
MNSEGGDELRAFTAFVPGAQVGPYRIEGALGAGGMGQVYKARDTRLDRSVAIKVLSERFGGRFEREARAISALNHPNICTLHDVGPNFLVMELVEGETVAERLKRGAVPLDEALRIARQIADALAAAHECGVIHRDLKPANIKIKPDGTVKVLDFGLAKVAREAAAAGGDSTEALSLTDAGTVLGTPSYMAPEQACGKAVDKRADIWAFGVVLYEMLAGQRLFQGDSVSEMLAAVLSKEPDWSRVPPKTERLLRRCLERDPDQRLRDIGDARFLLDDAAPHAIAAPRTGLAWKIAAIGFACVATAAVALFLRAPQPAGHPSLRLSVDLGAEAAIQPVRGPSMDLSPDGSQMVLIIGEPIVGSRLALRRLDQPKATPLTGTEGAEAPFFSPDGRSVAFFADHKLKKMDTAGSAPVTLCDVPSQRGGSWADDGTIVFAPSNHEGLLRIPSGGGNAQWITTVASNHFSEGHRYPQALPGAAGVLFVRGLDNEGEGAIEAQPFGTGKSKTLVEHGAFPRFLPSGHLVYMHGGALYAAPLDIRRLELTGDAVPVLEDVAFQRGTGTAGFAFSQSGTFVYAAAKAEDRMKQVGVIAAGGKLEPLPLPAAVWSHPRVSPDGQRLALTKQEGPRSSLWIYDWRSGRLSLFPFRNGNSERGVWTPDGKFLFFFSDAASPGPGIYCMRSDGGGEPQRVVEGARLAPWSLSGRADRLLYSIRGGDDEGLRQIPLDWSDPARPKPGATEMLFPEESPGALSPGDRWLSYSTGMTGVPEVMVRPRLGNGGPWQVSSGGDYPVWSQNGRELLYIALPSFRIVAAPYTATGDSFSPGTPREWSDIRVESFDLMPDGKRVVAVPQGEQRQVTHATFLLNFMEELGRRAPAGKGR